jgi:hypothetical protein
MESLSHLLRDIEQADKYNLPFDPGRWFLRNIRDLVEWETAGKLVPHSRESLRNWLLKLSFTVAFHSHMTLSRIIN